MMMMVVMNKLVLLFVDKKILFIIIILMALRENFGCSRIAIFLENPQSNVHIHTIKNLVES